MRSNWLHAIVIELSEKEAFMSSWHKVCSTLIAALLAGLASTPYAAVAGSPDLSGAAVTPYQKQETPPDCKRKPDDPRCKKKPY